MKRGIRAVLPIRGDHWDEEGGQGLSNRNGPGRHYRVNPSTGGRGGSRVVTVATFGNISQVPGMRIGGASHRRQVSNPSAAETSAGEGMAAMAAETVPALARYDGSCSKRSRAPEMASGVAASGRSEIPAAALATAWAFRN